MKTIDVGLGIVVRNGLVLICQRRSDGVWGDYWEFPGGKVEPDESPIQCARRELAEEVAVTVGEVIALPAFEYTYGQTTVRLHPFICTWQSGEPQPLASQRLAWVSPQELGAYRFPPANDVLIPQIIEWMAAQS